MVPKPHLSKVVPEEPPRLASLGSPPNLGGSQWNTLYASEPRIRAVSAMAGMLLQFIIHALIDRCHSSQTGLTDTL